MAMTPNIIEERKSWHNAEAQLPFDQPHVHKFEQAMATDRENDEIYYYGRCKCGATEI